MSSASPADRRASYVDCDSSEEDYGRYRALSASAVVSLLVGIVSAAALLDFWALKAIPAIGIVAASVALWRIRANPEELSGTKPALVGLALSAAFLIGGSALSVYAYVAELPSGAQRISYDLLKPPAEQPDAPPAAAQALEGRRVFIKGYMYPTSHDHGITRFVLCRDNGDCCFGGSPPKSDMIFVQLKEPLQTNFTGGLRHVAGTFHVAGSHSSDVKKDVLYALEADYIK